MKSGAIPFNTPAVRKVFSPIRPVFDILAKNFLDNRKPEDLKYRNET